MEIGTGLLIRALGRGAAVRLQLQGVCMEPLLRDRDWAWIEPLGRPPRPGDVVLARTGRDRLVCHRVLARLGSGVLAAGDRSSEVLQHREENVLGRLAAVERDGDRRRFRRRTIDGLLARVQMAAHAFRHPLARRMVHRLRRRLPVRLVPSDSLLSRD